MTKISLDYDPMSPNVFMRTTLNYEEMLNSTRFMDYLMNEITSEIAKTFTATVYPRIEEKITTEITAKLTESVVKELLPEIVKKLDPQAIANIVLLNSSREVAKSLSGSQTT